MTVSCMDNHKEQQMKISMADSTVIRIQQEEFLPKEITLEKDFLYNKHTLEDTVPYKKGVHIFQWDKIKAALERLDSIQNESSVSWGYIFNRKNRN